MNQPEVFPISVLVVDDEPIVVSLVRDALEDIFPHIHTTYSPTEALDIIRDEEINLVITDVRMPQMTGIEMVRQAREMRPSLGAIFMTGYADLNSAKEAIRQGALDYIQKPFELADIRQTVNSAACKLLEQAADKQSGKHLERLSDLNEMIYTAGDRQSIILASLRFAILHCNSDRGCVVFAEKDEAELAVVTLCENQSEQADFAVESPSAFLFELMETQRNAPQIIDHLTAHPTMRKLMATNVGPTFVSLFGSYGGSIVTLPIYHGETIFGFMFVGLHENSQTVNEGNLKFLNITLSQLALSLENISLLEKTQAAYSRLKELQDVSIDLERLAARGEMAAEIAHELNNFIAVVSGKTELLEIQIRSGHTSTADNHISVIKENVEKIRRFASDMMDVRSNQTHLEIVSLKPILLEVIDYLKPQRRFSNVTFVKEFKTDPKFIGDVTQIQQLLYNMFNNAADAMTESTTREITVRLVDSSSPNRFKLSISDTGAGIDPEHLKKAFKERFTTKEHGHGYGLIVCGRIIEHHGGVLSVNSAPGSGTTIEIEFPHAHAHESATVC